MMKRICSLTILLLSAYTAMAQTNPRVTVFGAGSFVAGSREFLMNSNTAVRTEYDNGGKVGVRFGVDLRDNWAAEASYSFAKNNLRAINLNPPRREREFETRAHQFMVNGSYYFLDANEKWRPFATAGVGLYRLSPTKDAKGLAAVNFLDGPTRISSSSKFGVNFGGGFEGKIADYVGLRFDLRDHIMGMPRFGLPETPLNPGGAFYPISGLLNNLEIGVGAVFYFQ
jgi:outer membrane protein W